MPTTVLITAFEPYATWPTNASWLALIELTRNLPDEPKLTTRRYPVNFSEMKQRLAKDLEANYDFAIHLGQCPGSSWLRLETMGLNVSAGHNEAGESAQPLAVDGPPAYHSALPLGSMATALREAGIPARVSYHAGTFLCNATLYWSHYLAERMQLKTQAAFVHVPLDATQVLSAGKEQPSLSAQTSAAGLRMILSQLANYSV